MAGSQLGMVGSGSRPEASFMDFSYDGVSGREEYK